MHAKLTQTLVANLQPGPKDQSIIDTTVPGLAIRVRPSGAKTWIFRYRNADGAQCRFPLGAFPGLTVSDARTLALAAAGDVARGIDICARKQAARLEKEKSLEGTLKSFLDKSYEVWATAQLRSGTEQIARIKADFADWFDKPLFMIDHALVDEWRNQQLQRGKQPVTVNRDLQRLHGLMSKALEWKVIAAHPFAGLKPLRHDKSGRVRYLNEQEEATLRETLISREDQMRKARETFNAWRQARHLDPLPQRTEEFTDHLRPLVITALNTGLRRGELFNLRERDLDIAAGWLVVRGATAKSGQSRRIPLNREVRETLGAWRKQRGPLFPESLIFPGPKGKRLTRIDTAWRSLMRLAKVNDFRFHDCRHHFASRLVQSGVDLNTVRELLGHADIEMVLRYAHLAANNLSSAVEKLSRVSVSSNPSPRVDAAA